MVVKVATPLASVPVPIVPAAVLVKVTVPVGVAPPAVAATVAVKVTFEPCTGLVALMTSVVAVALDVLLLVRPTAFEVLAL